MLTIELKDIDFNLEWLDEGIRKAEVNKAIGDGTNGKSDTIK